MSAPLGSPVGAPVTMRLDRLLSNMGYGTRREIQALAKAQGVTLDGQPLTKADARIAVTPDLSRRMKVSGAWLDPPSPLALMLHKPVGVTCSHKETGALVYDLLPARWRRREPVLSTVGRLDKETSGLLLITDDGDLLHRIISPRRHVPKRYAVTLDRPLTGDEAQIFAAGDLMLEGETTPLLPASLEVEDATHARLTITEGRYHQVRRMFAAVGNHVAALHRDRIGELDLPPDLAAGAWRILGEAEIATIFTSPPAAFHPQNGA